MRFRDTVWDTAEFDVSRSRGFFSTEDNLSNTAISLPILKA